MKEVISEKGAMAPEELLSVFICVLEATESAHKKGVIHGDIRPSNVFVDSEGTVKVTDFGISKIIGATGMAPFTTTEGQVRYVSPEQIRRQPVDERSDIYSLGVLLYELATGKPPFLGQSAFEIMDKHINQLPPPARNVRPELPKNIADAIGKALQKSPAERFQSAKEFEAFLKGDATFSEVIRLNSQGFKFYNQGNYRAAIATWELVLKLDPNNAKAQGGIARARAHLEEAGEKSIFEAALEEVAPKRSAAKPGLAKPAVPAKPLKLARVAGSVLARALRSPRSLYGEPVLMFLLLVMLGVFLLAGILIFSLMKVNPEPSIEVVAPVPQELAEPRVGALAGAGQAGRDVRLDREALASDLAAEARKLCEGGQGRKALVKFEKAMQLTEEQRPEFAKDFSQCCLRLGKEMMKTDPDTAVEFFRKAIQLDPRCAEAYLQIGRVRSASGDFSAAIVHYKKALALNPDLDVARFNLGHAYLSLRMYSKAVREFRAVIKRGSELRCDAYANLGVTYYKMGKIKKAAQVLSKGCAICPNDKRLRARRDKVLQRLKYGSRKTSK